MRLHLLAVPGQPTTRANSTCAYSQKARKAARMFTDQGHEVYVYGTEDHEGAGVHIRSQDPGAIAKVAEPGDLLLCSFGNTQQHIAEALPDLRCIEYGIGYGGTFADFRVFESYAWMHTVYGAQEGAHGADGRAFDAVILNFFELEDFPEGPGGDYLLYLGRMEHRKGAGVAAQVAERAGVPLVFAGAGPLQPTYGDVLGPVGPTERAELLGNAMALLCPTQYLEPFGGAAIEAMLCGTPVIASDWGAFTETVVDGVNGYRCRMLGDYVSAVELAEDLDRQLIAELARRTYSLEAIAPRYERYFEQLQTLDGDGWNAADWRLVSARGE